MNTDNYSFMMFTCDVKVCAQDYVSNQLLYTIVEFDKMSAWGFKGHHESIQYLPSEKSPCSIKKRGLLVLRQELATVTALPYHSKLYSPHPS